MAVANKQKGRVPKSYVLELNDGQTVNVTAVRGGQTVGDERELAQVRRELAVIQGRTDFLTQEAIQAPDDATYNSKLRYAKKYERDFANIEPQIEKMLTAIISDWDMALTEEDEAAGDFIPLTIEGMKTLELIVKVDVFNKLLDKFKEDDDEKKESSVSSPDGTAVRESLASAQNGTSTTN